MTKRIVRLDDESLTTFEIESNDFFLGGDWVENEGLPIGRGLEKFKTQK